MPHGKQSHNLTRGPQCMSKISKPNETVNLFPALLSLISFPFSGISVSVFLCLVVSGVVRCRGVIGWHEKDISIRTVFESVLGRIIRLTIVISQGTENLFNIKVHN